MTIAYLWKTKITALKQNKSMNVPVLCAGVIMYQVQ